MNFWNWVIRWWLGDEKAFRASMNARPLPTIGKTLVLLLFAAGAVFTTYLIRSYAENIFSPKPSPTVSVYVKGADERGCTGGVVSIGSFPIQSGKSYSVVVGKSGNTTGTSSFNGNIVAQGASNCGNTYYIISTSSSDK